MGNNTQTCPYCGSSDGKHHPDCPYYNPISVEKIPDGRDLPKSKRNPFASEPIYEKVHVVGQEED